MYEWILQKTTKYGKLTPENISEIYNIFKDYMELDANIFTLTEINEFLINETNTEILKSYYKLWIESTNILKEIYIYESGCKKIIYQYYQIVFKSCINIKENFI